MSDIDFAARRPWFLDHLRALEAAGAITICAFDGVNQLLGFVTFDPATAFLDQLAVAPEAKGPAWPMSSLTRHAGFRQTVSFLKLIRTMRAR
jgi:hypothetical protein